MDVKLTGVEASFSHQAIINGRVSTNPDLRFTLFFRPGYIGTDEHSSRVNGSKMPGLHGDNLALIFHESLHGYGVATGEQGFGDAQLLNALGEIDKHGKLTPLNNAEGSVAISNYIKKHCF